jgi:hypothetical protein
MPPATDFLPRLKDRLFLDWDDAVFEGPLFVAEDGSARKKLRDLVSSRSEDAITWSVFRAFVRLPADIWLQALLSGAGRDAQPGRQDAGAPGPGTGAPDEVSLSFWQGGADVAIEGSRFAIAIDGKYTSDIASRGERDEIGRGLEAALDLAGPDRDPHFVLITDDYSHPQTESMARWLGPSSLLPPGQAGAPVLPTSREALMAYETLMPRYRDDAAFRASRLPKSSPEDLARLAGRIGWLSWADLVDGVLDRSGGLAPEQKKLLQELVNYLRPKRLLHKGSR